jgi:signal transduction histidine kinase
MASAAELLELGDRYWALGLPAAARSALGRALESSTDAHAALRLTDIALAQGDVRAARAFAAEAAKRAPGPATKIVLGRAQLAAGELSAARMTILVAIDSPKLQPWDRARAHLELSRVAAGQSDQAGAAAQAATAFEAMLVAAKTALEVEVAEEICAAVVAHGRAQDAAEQLAAARANPANAPTPLSIVAVSLLSARHAGGDQTVSDRMIDAELAAIDAASTAIALRRLERRARKHAAGDRAALLAEIGTLIETSASEQVAPAERARLQFLYGSLCAEDANLQAKAEEAYRKGLAYQPGHTAAACRLALLVLDRGDQAGALAEIERALRIDASHGLAWKSAARMIDAQSLGVSGVVQRLLDAANPGAGSVAGGVAPRLVTATAEVARHDVLAGVYAHGHRVKNLLGIIGSRARSARKISEGDVHERLVDLEKDVTALYEEWAQYLRSMQAPTPTVELVPLAPLLHEVVVAAQARTQQISIALETQAGLPDVRGDRMLLREALLNIVSNAAEACAHAGGGEVSVRARAVASAGTAPIVEIVVADSGPGIPREHLSRIFVPGFTTKETGSGVGLAIAERAVSAHHGRITLESPGEGGRGTTITVTLPTDKSGLQSLPLWSVTERS